MTINEYVTYLKADGHKVVERGNHYWLKKAPFFYCLIPEFKTVVIYPKDIKTIKREFLAGFAFPTSYLPDTNFFLHVIDTKEYNLSSITQKARNQTRRGLERTTVEQLNWKDLETKGVEINESALKRQGRKKWHPVLTDERLWVKRMRVCSQFSAVRAYGAFVDDILTAYVVTCIVEDHCLIQSAMSRLDTLKSYLNNALIYTVVCEMFRKYNVNEVSFGFRPVNENLMQFKINMGFKLKPIPYTIVINPLIKPFLKFSKKYRHYAGR